VSLNRCDTADRAEFRRRLLPGNMPCDGRSNFLDDVRTGDIGDDAQPTAAVRADRQIDRSTDRQIDRSTDRQIDRSIANTRAQASVKFEYNTTANGD